MDFLTDPFEIEAIRTGAVAAAIVGVLCGVIGCYVVLRGLALVAEGLAHGVMPGVGIAFALTAGAAGASPDDTAITVGALVAALVTAAGTSLVLARSRLREDTAAGVVFVFMLALGVAVVSAVEGDEEEHHLEEFLFGDVLGVGWGDVAVTAVLTAAVLGMVVVLYRPFLMLSFDRKRAAAVGLPVDALQLVMLVVLALAVVVGFRVVGALLVLGLLIAPAAAAALLTKRLPAMMAVSAGIAALSGPIGLLASWHLEIEAGPAIVLVAVAAFAAALAARPALR